MKCNDTTLVYNGQINTGTLYISSNKAGGVDLSLIKQLKRREVALKTVSDYPEELFKDIFYVGAKMLKGTLTGRPGPATRQSGFIEAYKDVKEKNTEELCKVEIRSISRLELKENNIIINECLQLLFLFQYDATRCFSALKATMKGKPPWWF